MEQSEIFELQKKKKKIAGEISAEDINGDGEIIESGGNKERKEQDICFYSLTKENVLKTLGGNKGVGLSSAEAEKRKKYFGANVLKEAKPKNIFVRFLQQFSDFMIIILLAAAAISFATAVIDGRSSEFLDPVIILVIVIINAVTGIIQEFKAEKAIHALKKLTTSEALALRDGKKDKIPAENLVPGDIIFLESGDAVPADARILENLSVESDESALTGESMPVQKDDRRILPQETSLGDRKNMLYMTGVITAGKCSAVVTNTGMSTEVGKIAKILTYEDESTTPLQEKLAKTGKILGITALSVCSIIFLLGIINKTPALEMFMLAISLAVAAMPEGLPAIVTIVLAIGVQRMAKNKAIVRRLSAVETLGSATVICSDKTGTLTQNKMTAVKIYASDGTSADIGAQSKAGNEIAEIAGTGVRNTLVLAALCNNASAQTKSIKNTSGIRDIKARREIKKEAVSGYRGNPTETALCDAGEKFGVYKAEEEKKYRRVSEIPFDSNRKLMTTVHIIPDGGEKVRIITKGAPDVLLAGCTHYAGRTGIQPMSRAKRSEFLDCNEKMAERALRVIAVAYKDAAKDSGRSGGGSSSIPATPSALENNLVFCGLIGMIDPPRPEVFKAVKMCKTAGIKPVMITGDHKITAVAIAGQIGIYDKNDINSKVATGAEIDKIPDDEFVANIYSYSVFARVSPEHKVRIVKAFKQRGNIVAMTGDGVNDAPSLKIADIGCAMGKNGTDVARNSADMILVDDNFSTIVEAVRQGRGIYDNIKKAVHFLLSSNFGEIMTIFSAFFLKLPTPLIAIHLLWVNFVTDSLPALALSAEKPDESIMKRPPVNSGKSLFADGLGLKIIFEGFMIGSLTLLAFVIGYKYFDKASVPAVGRTMAFLTLSLSQLVHAYNMRSTHSVFKIGVFSNAKMNIAFAVCTFMQIAVVVLKPLSDVFKTVNLNFCQWGIVALLSFAPLVIVELQKLITRE